MNVGYGATAVGVGLAVASIALHWPIWARAMWFMPGALAATGFLQAKRNTCVAHAAKGTFEHEDFSTTKAPDDEVAASRKVAATIKRDAILIGLASAALGFASAFVSSPR